MPPPSLPPSDWGRADLHVHPLSSVNADYEPQPMLEQLLRSSLDIVAITEHDRTDLAFDLAARLEAAGSNIDVIIGAEVTTSEGHLLALFLQSDIPVGLSPAEAIANIHAQGGLAIIAHPLLPSASCLSGRQIRQLMQRRDHQRPDAIETHNSIALVAPLQARLAQTLAKQLSLAQVGGSDAHGPDMLGNCITRFPGRGAGELRQAIENCASVGEGRASETLWQNIGAFPARWLSAHRAGRQ
jgi:predicted metal-dependent phosphoesterase TrpH